MTELEYLSLGQGAVPPLLDQKFTWDFTRRFQLGCQFPVSILIPAPHLHFFLCL